MVFLSVALLLVCLNNVQATRIWAKREPMIPSIGEPRAPIIEASLPIVAHSTDTIQQVSHQLGLSRMR